MRHPRLPLPTLTELRPNYELLFMKVQSLIQKDDPSLASDVDTSREAIWGMLAGKNKFALIQENPMNHRIALLLAVAALFALPSFAATDAAVLKDLTAVIALHGLPCGEVTQADRKGDNDYVATCKDGRVVVEKQ